MWTAVGDSGKTEALRCSFVLIYIALLLNWVVCVFLACCVFFAHFMRAFVFRKVRVVTVALHVHQCPCVDFFFVIVNRNAV